MLLEDYRGDIRRELTSDFHSHNTVPFLPLPYSHSPMQAKLSNAPVAIICINIMKIEDIHSRKVDVSDY
jgi:hypothetical protein